jgi:hypothetical protein
VSINKQHINTTKETCHAAITPNIMRYTHSGLVVCGFTFNRLRQRGRFVEAQISGTWQNAEGDCNVQINLAAEPKTITLDGHAYPATIDKVNTGSYSVHLKVETETGKAEEWIIRQVWDDNGSSYQSRL